MVKVVIGTYCVNGNGKLEDLTQPVEFEGEELFRHQWRTSETSGVRQRLFRTADDRYIVSIAFWTVKPKERTTYTLREINRADLLKGGEYEDLGKAWRGESLGLDRALTLEKALKLPLLSSPQERTMIADLETQTNVNLIPGTLAEVGQVANQVAARHVFDDYRSRKAENTLRRHDADLALFADFLANVGVPVGDLGHDPEAWAGITWGLVEAFVKWQLGRGYSLASINARLSTVKVYAGLAVKSGVLDTSEYALIRLVQGYNGSEARHVDEKREAADVPVRLGHKKAEPVSISQEQAKALKDQPDTSQGRRDAVIMTLLLDLGLRCGELAALQIEDFDLERGSVSFFRTKVNKTQTHTLTDDTLAALQAYLDHDRKAKEGPLLRGSRKGCGLQEPGMSERAITARVKVLGERLGIEGLSAHDLRHHWATQAARSGTPLDRLMDAGGWASPDMPMRYIEAARIANQGVKLEGGE